MQKKSLVDKVVYYLNDVLVSLDIAPIQKVGNQEKNKSNTITKTNINN
ncbi:hypothetical protein [Kordia jejudonensis]|nr:hypothetical protein [Kordia jejudonensis]